MKAKIYLLIILFAWSALIPTGLSAGLLQSNATLSSSGVVQQTPTGPYSYTISILGSNYIMKNETNEQIIYQSTNAAQVVNNAIGNLTQGGNILIKAGTYTLSRSITATGINNINLHFEEGAILFVSNGMNAPAILLTGVSNWLIQNPTIDGNLANQAVATGDGGLGMSLFGIEINGGSNNLIDGADITRCGQFGVNIVGYFPGDAIHNGVTNSLITYCGWNGLIAQPVPPANGDYNTVSNYCTDNYFRNNEVSHCGDVGISTYGERTIIDSNYVHDMDGTFGWNNAGYGIGVEGGKQATIENNNVSHVKFGIIVAFDGAGYNNILSNKVEYSSQHGMFIQSSNNRIAKNQVFQYDTSISGSAGIVLMEGNPLGQNGNIVAENEITNSYAEAKAITIGYNNGAQIFNNTIISPQTSNTYAIQSILSNNINIEQNKINGAFGVSISSGCLSNIIKNNNLTQCTNAKISDSGTATSIFGNAGYNPIGAITNPARGNLIVDSGSSSTWGNGTTYTNWESPKVLDISGGIATVIAVNGQTLFTEITTIAITLQPGDTFKVTFSSAPTIKATGQ